VRIAHVINDNETNITGDLTQTLNLAVVQKERGSDVTVTTDQAGGTLARACRQHGIPVTVAAGLKEARSPDPVPETIADLIGQFRAFGPDVIHCHSLAAAGQAIQAGNQADIPCVLTLHAVDFRILLDASRGSDLRFTTIAVCRSHFEKLRESGVIPEAELHYVPHGTKITAPRTEPPGGARGKQGPGRPNLMLVGSLSTRKGIDIAILVMADLRRRRGPDCPELNIYGQGLPMAIRPGRSTERRLNSRSYFEEMVSVLELDDVVHFRGTEPDVLDHCSGTDILIVPSRAETGPLVVLEAMSRGMPVVAANVGEVNEMLPDQRYGRIVPTETIIPFTDAVESVLSDIAGGRFDPGLLIERHRSHYSSEKVADRVEAVYRQVLHNGSPSRPERRRRPVVAG
jgi:glycosyltransferase involved in cell wall biosynthesis